ncbi:MAG: transposase [Christensenellales bacterium]
MTYLIFNNKRAYLSTILDLFDRKVVAYRISKFNDNQLVIDTLNEAIAKNKDVHGLIIHSDQGFQYTSFSYKAICESVGIQISMSRAREHRLMILQWKVIISILKKRLLYNNYITNLEEYIAIVEDWIEFYNTKRIKNRKRK